MKKIVVGLGAGIIVLGALIAKQTPPEYSSRCAIEACTNTPDVNLIPFDGHFSMNPATHRLEVGAGNVLKFHVVKTTPEVAYISIEGIGVFAVTVIFNTGTGEQIPVTYAIDNDTRALSMDDPHSAMRDQPQSFATADGMVIAIPYNSSVPTQVIVDNSEAGRLSKTLGLDQPKAVVTVESVDLDQFAK